MSVFISLLVCERTALILDPALIRRNTVDWKKKIKMSNCRLSHQTSTYFLKLMKTWKFAVLGNSAIQMHKMQVKYIEMEVSCECFVFDCRRMVDAWLTHFSSRFHICDPLKRLQTFPRVIEMENWAKMA